MHARSSIRQSVSHLVEGTLTLDVNDMLRRGTLARGSCAA